VAYVLRLLSRSVSTCTEFVSAIGPSDLQLARANAAIGGKADIHRNIGQCPFMTHSGHCVRPHSEINRSATFLLSRFLLPPASRA
jgi:hypothetical protein